MRKKMKRQKGAEKRGTFFEEVLKKKEKVEQTWQI